MPEFALKYIFEVFHFSKTLSILECTSFSQGFILSGFQCCAQIKLACVYPTKKHLHQNVFKIHLFHT